MLELHANNTKLLLPESSQVKIDLVPPVMADGIEDNYTIPFAVPARGNERALGHVQHLPQAERTLVLKDARLGYAGQHMAKGVLRVLGSNAEAIKLSFSTQGLVDRLAGIKLRDVLAGNTIDTIPDGGILAHAKLVTMVDQPHRSHCFPMHMNTSLYGSENPAWQPDARGWDATTAYSINDLVTLEETDPVLRKWTWQCTGANTNKPPNLYPAYWRRACFGLVNSYDVDLQQYDSNDEDGNYYALVPWFRYDWLVRMAVAGLGLRATGDWFNAPATPLMLLPNSTPLDAAERLGQFAARQTVDLTVHAPNTIQDLPANEDTVAPFVDPDGVWDPSAKLFTPDTAGLWTFQVFLAASLSSADRMSVYTLWDDTGESLVNGPQGVTNSPAGSYGTEHSVVLTLTRTIAAANVGRAIRFKVRPTYAMGGMGTMTLRNCYIIGWRGGAAQQNSFSDVIYPERHVPDMELGEFLQHVADTFGLEVVPRMEQDTIEFNVKSNVVRGYTTAEDQSLRVAGEVEMDHGRRMEGLRFAWGVDAVDPATLLDSTEQLSVDFEEDLQNLDAPKQHCTIRSTRAVVLSKWHAGTNQYVWTPVGYSIPAAVSGDADTATDMPVAIKPLMLDEQWVDGRKLLMPRMEQAGESAFFATGPKSSELLLCVNGLKQAAREDGGLYPGAMSWGLDNAGNECESLLLQPQRDEPSRPDFWLRWHQAWADTLVRSEPVTTDLLVDLPFLRGRAWHRIMPMQGQLYLLERLPVNLGNGSATDMLCKGAYLRRLRPAVQPWPVPPPPFTCSAPGYARIVSDQDGGTWDVFIATTTGHFSVRTASGAILVDPSPIPYGESCYYSSDSHGHQSGYVTEIDVESGGLAKIDVATSSLTLYQVLYATGLSTIADLSGNAGLSHFYVIGLPLVAILPNFHPNALLSITVDDLPSLTSVGTLPRIASLYIRNTGIISPDVVDAIVNALDSASTGTKVAEFNGLLSLRTAASDTNYSSCISAGWTIT